MLSGFLCKNSYILISLLPIIVVFMIFQSITKDLEYDYIREPAEFDKETFEKTIGEIEAKIRENK